MKSLIPLWVTLEPNEFVESASAVTIYTSKKSGTTPREVKEWLRNVKRPLTSWPTLSLWVDTSDPYFEVTKTLHQPFTEAVRWQAHPTA